MHVIRTWGVVDPSGLGGVRHAITRALGPAAGPAPAVGVLTSGGISDVPEPGLGGMTGLRSRMALCCSELVTNALRHGQVPVEVALLTDGAAWLLDVTDHATDRLPEPYPDRPLGQGGYGLLLVARVASQLGWYVTGDAKHVWARVELAADADLLDRLSAG